ncbi:cAMP-binding domain of CRP or a regulatory subunit of cAMP-dependent protein kinases [Pedobacter westerhofensis]|uniref:cAMP-binding domain of CRP or a regulatory subunit of cAMP-dependent protein kinases n=1 Tax=Pedobacter westerhofensis TaxID=425512 RepID=A0A521B6P2_9SPHI|nr:Crp/Fnr family transcriptional regulator [Pedobacter westerhofensis]SMO42768.1 cAMP-binding domain of CRP or a regulatory subunit of cAMP-dependent protein kinases [Pedobacter westerhofensis]
MVNHGLYDVLFNVKNLPDELKDGNTREELMRFIDLHLTTSNHKKNQLLLTPGHIADQIYFLERGAARGYFHDEDGKEHTLYFWDEKSFVIDSLSFFSDQPSDLYIEVMQDSILLSLSRRKLNEILKSFPCLNMVIDLIMLNDFKQCRKRIMDFISLNPVGRYVQLVKSIPRVDLKFHQQEIASYLGTSRQTVSRSKRA